MAKLRDLITEREFGEPLPTFKDVMEKHQVNKLKEDWWDDMTPEQQAQYIKDHPGSKQAQSAKDKEEPKKDVKGREYDPMTGKGKGKDSRNEPDDEEYFKSMMGGGEPDDKPFGGDTGRDADSGAVDGPSPEDGDWDSEQVMTAKLDGEEVGDIIDQGEDHPNYDKAMDYVLQFDPDDEKVISGPGRKKEESIIINGKKYRAIKESVESKKHLLREMYERIGGK